ncbi:hypothetical protein [Arthrobacter crystallopoietes]|uniref:hypothetical protein n=1 Tax=Crystallibacter crystallopoietes TaxID=37928 RepID=UPI001ABE6820|nr:hypothetical protein [Arthrobacter crystallopoietes]QTG81830.1 hypothetical protein J5251_04340 [Arthrobacter crystallopoietes]
MYGWIFRHLPGPLCVRIIVSILLIAGAVLLLLQFVFPWLSQFNPLTDSTIGTIE